ncbi:MAG: hypothetical protein RLZZ490_119 [Cyanobacteriota bacterium]
MTKQNYSLLIHRKRAYAAIDVDETSEDGKTSPQISTDCQRLNGT